MQTRKYAMDLSLNDKIYYFTSHEKIPLSKYIKNINGDDPINVTVVVPGICLSFKKDKLFKDSTRTFIPEEQVYYFTNELEMLLELENSIANDIQKTKEESERLLSLQIKIDEKIKSLSNAK